MSINERIKLIVDLYYDSQAELAKELGVSRVAIGSYINSDRKPNTDVYEKFYQLGYNLNWLVSGNGTEKRCLINKEMLDDYDKVVFGVTQIEEIKIALLTTSQDGPIKTTAENWVKNFDEQLAYELKKMFYLEKSYYALETIIQKSDFEKYLHDNLIYPNYSMFNLTVKIPLMRLIEDSMNLNKHKLISIEINKNVNKEEFEKNLSCYIFLITELVYYSQSLKESQTIEYKEHDYKTNESDNHLYLSKPGHAQFIISFEELKNRFIHHSEIVKNESYVKSKSMVFYSLINKIFKIEQSN